MKRIAISCLLGALLSAAMDSRAVALAPEQGTVMALEIGGKQSTYYRLEKDSASWITVNGPGRLTCIVRLVFPHGVQEPQAYGLVVSEGDRVLKSVQSLTRLSEWHWVGLADEGAGLARRFSVNIPKGSHRLRVELKQTNVAAAAVRYLVRNKSPHSDESSLYPTAMAGTATVLVKERPLEFFLSDTLKPVSVNVIGPTRLRVVTRLAYSGTMKGPQRYGLRVSLDGQAVPTEALLTEKAITTSFGNHPEWSVGESRTIYFPISAGTHRMDFHLTGTEAPAVAMRFTIPRENTDVESE